MDEDHREEEKEEQTVESVTRSTITQKKNSLFSGNRFTFISHGKVSLNAQLLLAFAVIFIGFAVTLVVFGDVFINFIWNTYYNSPQFSQEEAPPDKPAEPPAVVTPPVKPPKPAKQDGASTSVKDSIRTTIKAPKLKPKQNIEDILNMRIQTTFEDTVIKKYTVDSSNIE